MQEIEEDSKNGRAKTQGKHKRNSGQRKHPLTYWFPSAWVSWSLKLVTLLWKKLVDGELNPSFGVIFKLFSQQETLKDFWRNQNVVLLIDEAQDLNDVQLFVLEQWSCPKIYVGDPNQQIYAWRGCRDGLATLPPSATRFKLTQSFRFDSEIATVGDTFLQTLKVSNTLTVPRLLGRGLCYMPDNRHQEDHPSAVPIVIRDSDDDDDEEEEYADFFHDIIQANDDDNVDDFCLNTLPYESDRGTPQPQATEILQTTLASGSYEGVLPRTVLCRMNITVFQVVLGEVQNGMKRVIHVQPPSKMQRVLSILCGLLPLVPLLAASSADKNRQQHLGNPSSFEDNMSDNSQPVSSQTNSPRMLNESLGKDVPHPIKEIWRDGVSSFKELLKKVNNRSPDAAQYLIALQDLAARYGATVESIKQAVGRIRSFITDCEGKKKYDLLVTTVHQSKGLEYDAVEVANDIFNPRDRDSTCKLWYTSTQEEINCLYVAATRARQCLILPKHPFKWWQDNIIASRFVLRSGLECSSCRQSDIICFTALDRQGRSIPQTPIYCKCCAPTNKYLWLSVLQGKLM
eukprot:m.15808 g.15808  ORF g.15808 m.15808 type:complete len:571 (-) comp9987_c0_seq1:69-1781(-)